MMPEQWVMPDYWVPCAEIDALAEELAIKGARFVVEGPSIVPGWYVTYSSIIGDVSVSWSPWSRGHVEGLLEAMLLGGDMTERVGWLTAGSVLRVYPPEVVA